MTAAEVTCAACGTALPPSSKFCNDCGATVSAATKSAEYKQVTVLFADVEVALDLLAKVGARARDERFTLSIVPIANSYLALEQARVGDVEGAISLARSTVNDLAISDRCIFNALATNALVEVLLQRGEQPDIDDVQAAVDWLETVATDEGFVINEITLLRLRALLARANGDQAAHLDYRDSYRKMANDLGFEGHMAWAEAMP
jgi:adenylate cyclase